MTTSNRLAAALLGAALLPLTQSWARAQTPEQPAALPAETPAPAPARKPAAAVLLRPQTVAPLPGGLDQVLVVNDNNPELITTPGVLVSTFAGQGRGVPQAHLNVPLNGRFDLFSHHVYAGQPDRLDSTLWLALVAQPRGSTPVTLKLLAGSTALSQSLDAIQSGAPFLPLPTLLPLNGMHL